ncbi:toprim domain-containing protein [Nitrobacteraceae bacterium UC4449_H16]
MADDPVWLATAKTLQAGRRIRIECCSQDKSLMVSNEERGYRAYCFRCGPRGFVAHGDFSIDQLRRRREEFALLQEAHVRLPKDFTTEIPPNEAIWLLRAGIGNVLAKACDFGYSRSLRRVVLPVKGIRGELIGFTARSTIGAKPKYIERMCTGSAVFVADPVTALPATEDWPEGSGPDLVITEDILSAVRVGRLAKRCVALLGTTANAEQLAHILPSADGRISIWLDPDRAGRVAAQKLERTLALQGYTTKRIRTKQDPKCYSNREIRRLLSST